MDALRVNVDSLKFSFSGDDNNLVLDDVSFATSEGSIFGIIGPNGSGKTTLLRCISGILRPQAGSITLGGSLVGDLERRDIAKSLAFVPQSSEIDFEYTVSEIVSMGRTPHLGRFDIEGERDKKIVAQAMDLTGISVLEGRLYNELSGGERQRVILARALAQEPMVLLLDEPTAHLDIGTQYGMLELINRLCIERQITAIGVFHDLNLASQYCKKLLLLDWGRAVACGIPSDVVTPENIRRAYGIDVLVRNNPMTGLPQITPYYSKRPPPRDKLVRIHLVCGGGSGASIMKMLREQGFEVSAGVLSKFDSDFDVAQALGIEFTEESPFSHIGDAASDKNMRLMSEADAIIVTDFPVGPGNLINITSVIDMAKKKKPVILIAGSQITQRDFTGGAFLRAWDELGKYSKFAKDGQNAVELVESALIKGDETIRRDD